VCFSFHTFDFAPAKDFVEKKSRRLLLREAVQRAEAPDQIHGVNADDGTVAEQFTQNAERDAVVRVVERRDDDGGVADVKMCIRDRNRSV